MISKSLLYDILRAYKVKYNNKLTLDPDIVDELAHYIVEQYFIRTKNNDSPTEVFAACRVLEKETTNISLDRYKTEWFAECTLPDDTEHFGSSTSDATNKIESALVNLATAIVNRS